MQLIALSNSVKPDVRPQVSSFQELDPDLSLNSSLIVFPKQVFLNLRFTDRVVEILVLLESHHRQVSVSPIELLVSDIFIRT